MSEMQRYHLTCSTNGITQWALEFEHERYDPIVHGASGTGWVMAFHSRGRLGEVVCARRTIARAIPIDDAGTRGEAIEGFAYCSPRDTFDREIGRQVALRDLMEHLPAHRGDRLGQCLLRAYVSRPSALPWVIDAQGHVNYERLQAARIERRNLRDADHLFQQLSRVDSFITMHNDAQARLQRLMDQMPARAHADMTKH